MASSSTPGERRLGPEWAQVTDISKDGKGSGHASCRCIHCGAFWDYTNATRIRAHFLGGMNDVVYCKKAPREVRDALQASRVKKQKTLHGTFLKTPSSFQPESASAIPTNLGGSSLSHSLSHSPSESPNMIQSKLDGAAAKAAKDTVDEQVARVFYNCGLAFNICTSPDFKRMCNLIAKFGKEHGKGQYAPPGLHRLRTTLLSKEKTKISLEMGGFRKTFELYGCTIVSDGWTDVQNRPLINVLLVSPFGVEFVDAINASGEEKSGEYIFERLRKVIEDVGPKGVVQVIMDGASNCVSAGRKLEEEYPHLTFSKCAAHSLDLMLADIGKLPWVASIVATARDIVVFITNHQRLDHIFQGFAKKKLAKPAATRFGTNFIMLSCLSSCQGFLQQCVMDPEWKAIVAKKDNKVKGALVLATAIDTAWWTQVANLLKLLKPVFLLMRSMDGNVPTVGKVYCHMSNCLESCNEDTNISKARLKQVADIVGARWNYMHSPFHSAAYVLDPEYMKCDWFGIKEVKKQFTQVLTQLFDARFARAALDETERYSNLTDTDALADAADTPGHIWWKRHGADFPHLRAAGWKILGQVASACACERNWSTYDFIHSRVRNRLTPERARDLVYVFSNSALIANMQDAGGQFRYIPWTHGVAEPAKELPEPVPTVAIDPDAPQDETNPAAPQDETNDPPDEDEIATVIFPEITETDDEEEENNGADEDEE
jgi:Protein of unknown function (DUF 659)/hAT family C-terminal dimerisation region